MKKIIVSLEKAETITLGRQGEKNSTTVMWNISQWVNDFGLGKAVLLYTLDGAENAPYPCHVTMDGSWARWLITPSELMLGSRGKCQLVYVVSTEIVAKSPVYMTRVQSSLGEKSSEPPESFIGWVDSVLQAGEATEKAARRAEEAVGQLDDTVESAKSQIMQITSQAIQSAEETTTQLENTIYKVTQSSSQAVQSAEETISQLENTVDQATQSSSQIVQSAEETITQLENTIYEVTNSISQAVQSAEETISQLEDAAHQASLSGSQAIQEVEDAAEEKIEQIKEIIAPIPAVTDKDNGKIMTVINGKWTAVEPTVMKWEKVQLIVRAGLAPQYFPIGYEFVTHDSVQNTDIIWRVVGYDTIKATDELLTHTMILETKHVYSDFNGTSIGIQFDAPEFLYYAETGLKAGTYHFTLPAGYDTLYGGGKTYSFTLLQSVPANGMIMFPWGYNQQAISTKVSTYASQVATEAIESVNVSESVEGELLGEANGQTINMNHIQRVRFGSNNYAQSAVRQWLNSRNESQNIWEPTTKYDRLPSYKADGFMKGLPADFLKVVQAAAIPCITNSLYEENNLNGTVFTTNQIYILADKFFLLSQSEIYGTWENKDYRDGVKLDFYTDLTNPERIKYSKSGAVAISWMRSPTSSSGNYNKSINAQGNLSGTLANNSIAVCPACIIA